MEDADLRIWLCKPYRSDAGNARLTAYTSRTTA